MTMIIIEEKITIEEKIDKLIDDESVFLDIETTGFNRQNCRIYLVGYLAKKNGEYYFIQLMTENSSEEKTLLKRLVKDLNNYSCLYTFNGERFDIPFINSRCKKYHIDPISSDLVHTDLYIDIKNRGFLLETEDFKLNTLEKNIGIDRKDIFDGGELITLYYEYEATKNKKLEYVLLLHNREDILHLPYLLEYDSILNDLNTIYYEDYKFIIHSANTTQSGTIVTGESNIENGYLNWNNYKLEIKGGKLILKGPVEIGKYDDSTTVLYVKKDNLNIKCQMEVRSPEEILILKLGREVFYKNIIELFSGIVRDNLK